MSSFTSNSSYSCQSANAITQEVSTISAAESAMFDIFNGDEETPLLANSSRTSHRPNSRRASTSSCPDSDTESDISTPMDMDDTHEFSSPTKGEHPKCTAWVRHAVHCTHDRTTNQHIRVHRVEISQYENYSAGDDTPETETVLVDLSALSAAELSQAIMTGTSINLKLVAAGARESFKYRVNKVKVKTWIRHVAFVHDDELQCYIRRKE